VPGGEYGEQSDQAAADHVGAEHDRARPDLVGEPATEWDEHCARHAIASQHGAEQHRAAVRGQHQPGQRDGIAEVASSRCELARGQQPEVPVRERTAPPCGPDPLRRLH